MLNDEFMVTIIGRENVGKSSLFNKLTGNHKSIVDDYPGVTRDMVEGSVNWLGRRFKLIDTGGVIYENPDKIKKLVLRQIEKLIKMSDLVLLVVDSISGLMPDDKKICEYLRKNGKDFMLVVNKCDNENLINNSYEFYKLGVNKLFAVSAEHSTGLDSILDYVISKIPEPSERIENKKIPRITITGKENVGKSSLFNALINEERMIVTDVPGTTRDAIDAEVKINDKKFIFVDTAGIKKRKNIKEKILEFSVGRAFANIKRSDIVIHVIDVSEGLTEIDKKILGYVKDNCKGIILAVNKWDVIDLKERKRTMKKYINYVKGTLPFLDFMPVVFISALKRINLQKLIDVVIDVENQYNQRIKTSSLNRIFEDVLFKNPAQTKSGKLKVNYITQIGVAPPTFVIFVNGKDKIDSSYLRYVEGKIRENCGFNGVSLKFKTKQKEK
ncbi:MAG: ribosome biogenesis GTPase Der [Candidatus Goldbacteria bacterium]|nr:ribosome biogenesis GTPase Der [Candidatus Goldiibacteriota bacterium]